MATVGNGTRWSMLLFGMLAVAGCASSDPFFGATETFFPLEPITQQQGKAPGAEVAPAAPATAGQPGRIWETGLPSMLGGVTKESCSWCAPGQCEMDAVAPNDKTAVWGILGFRGYAYGERTGPNGVEYAQLFSLDFDFNLWIWRSQKVYLYTESKFWGQKPGVGITNPSQGNFDFSKREFDFNVGLAWNYFGFLEARFFGYSANNLNRGNSLSSPSGFNDGVGLENRLYLSRMYQNLGTANFDLAKATFVSVGYYPSKVMVDTEGTPFRPGPFARAYLTYDLGTAWNSYVFLDARLLGQRDFTLKLFNAETGIAIRPLESHQRFEVRFGVENIWDIPLGDTQTGLYGQIRFIY